MLFRAGQRFPSLSEESTSAERTEASAHAAAEVLAFGRREGIEPSLIFDAVKGISWILPERPLAAELARIIGARHLRGADLWHLACACYLSPVPERVAFLTKDSSQREVAFRFGFQTPAFT